MKKILGIIFIFSACILQIGALQALSAEKELYRSDSWGFMEDIFISEPDMEISSYWSFFRRSLAISSGVVVGGFGVYKFLEYLNTHYSMVSGSVCGGVSSVVFLKLMNYYIETFANERALLNFIIEWDENREFVPNEFVSAFDALAYTYALKGEDGVRSAAKKLMSLIKKKIYNHYPDKYKRRLQVDNEDYTASFYHQIVSFNFDVGGFLEGLGSFVRECTNSYLKYSKETEEQRQKMQKNKEQPVATEGSPIPSAPYAWQVYGEANK